MRVLPLAIAALAACTFAQARDMAERNAFIRENPKPADCQKCEVDHKHALMNGGADKRSNMQWLSREDHKAKTKEDFKARKAK